MEGGFWDKACAVCGELTLDEKISLLCTHQRAIPRVGLDEFYIGTEPARGFVGRQEDKFSTVFPQPVGMAGTFDKGLMLELGEICGNEARAYYNAYPEISPIMWGPTVDMERDPRWGRTEEAYGEDPCLAGEMTAAYTNGMAGDNGKYLKTIPTLKHFCANNNEENRGGSNSFLPLRLKYEYYYAAFMAPIVFGGAKSVMAAYNEINGVPGMCNPDIKNILKDKWGLWYAVTDGGDFSQNYAVHRYNADHGEAIAESLKAGCDVMTDDEELVVKAAKDALERGLITENDIDENVNRILYARLKLGHTAEDCEYDRIGLDVLDDPKSAEMCLRAAREQMVLLKNNGLLPVKNTPKKIAVVGALAEENCRDWYTGYFRDAVTPAEGIRREFPNSEVVVDTLWDIVAIAAPNGKYICAHEDGSVRADGEKNSPDTLWEMRDWGDGWVTFFSVKYGKYMRFSHELLKLNKRDIYDWFTGETFTLREVGGGTVFEEYLFHKRMVCCEDGGLLFMPQSNIMPDNMFKIETVSRGIDRFEALDCDLKVLCLGNHPIQAAKECYDRKSLRLNIQPHIAAAACRHPENTVLAVISSFPYAINEEDEKLPAIVYTTHAGGTLGTALAETISGKNNPAGRLAMTWYRSEHELPDILDYDIEKGGTTYMYFKGDPLYPFGYGLSYSRFKYISIRVETMPDGGARAFVEVENVSDTDGDEVVQLYFTVPSSAVSRPVKKLCAFERVHIRAHETVTVELSVKPYIMQIFDVRRGELITEKGEYVFTVGGSSAAAELTAAADMDGVELAPRNGRFAAVTYDSGCCVKIAWSRKLRENYLKCERWSGTVVYTGLDLRGKSKLKVRASSAMRPAPLDIEIGGKNYSVLIGADMAFDDFHDYTLDIEGSDLDYVVLGLKEGMGVLEMEIV